MFTSQSLRAVLPAGALTVREQRLDDVVHQLDVRGTLDATTMGELSRRIDAALSIGVRWLIVDIAAATTVADEALTALVGAARELRARRATSRSGSRASRSRTGPRRRPPSTRRS